MGATLIDRQSGPLTEADIAPAGDLRYASVNVAQAFTTAQKSQALKNLGNASSLFDAVLPVGSGVRVTSGDCNNLVNDGFYTVEGACTNQPVAGIQFFFMVQKYAAGVGYVSQVALDINTVGGGAMYMRSSSASVWGAWHQIPRTSVGYGTLGQALISGGAAADATWKSGAWVLLNTVTASASASMDDTTSITSAYTTYEIVVENAVLATASQTLQLQVQSAAAFQTTTYVTGIIVGNGTTLANQANTTGLPLTNVGGAPTVAPGVSAKIHLANPAGTSFAKQMYGLWQGATGGINGSMGGFWNSAGAVTGVRLISTSGNITSGTMKIYGRN